MISRLKSSLQNASNAYSIKRHYLTDISLPVTTINVAIQIGNNSNKLVVGLSQLTTAGSITISSATSVDLSALNFLSGSLTLEDKLDNTMRNFTANNLSVVREDFVIVNNSLLTSVSLSGLLSAGTINIAENPGLETMSFDELSAVGSVNISGNLKRYAAPVILKSA